MSWNSEQELYLKHLGEQSMAYTWMQEQTAMFYIRINRWLGILIIIVSGAVGTNNFLDSDLTARNIIFGFLGYLVTILGMVNQFLKPLEDSQQRINIGNKYQDLYYDIKQQLAKPPEERRNVQEYLESITEKFIEIYDFSPTISAFIIQKFKQTFKDSNITMPLNANFIDEIKIFNNNHNDTVEIEMSKANSEPIEINQEFEKNRSEEFQDYIMSRLNTTNIS